MALWPAAAALLLAGSADAAAFWTATTNYAVVPTTDIYTYSDNYYSTTEVITDVYTSYLALDADASLDPADAFSTSTYVDSYDELELVMLYFDGQSVPEDAIATTTEYDYDAETTYTYYVQEITYTAPSSCETQFEVETITTIYIPSEVTNLVTPTSWVTTTDDYYYDETILIGYVDPDSVPPMTTDYEYDYVYDYVQSCINPTETSSFGYGDDDDDYDDANWGTPINGGSDDDDSESTSSDNSNSTLTYDCNAFNRCGTVAAWAIAIAAVLPAIFLLGFFESYFWFRRMMMGRSALRFGTCCWILLLVPVICFTRRCPAREAADQEALRDQWRKTSFGKALDLWFSWGFRLRYPVEVLGVHPKYNNPAIGPDGKALPDTGYMQPPPPKGFVYYVPSASANGATQGTSGNAARTRSSRPANGAAPPPEMAQTHPQYPPQAHGQRRQRQSRSQRQPATALPSQPESQQQPGRVSLPPQIPTPHLPSPIPEPSQPTEEREAPAAAPEQTTEPRPASPEPTQQPPAPEREPPSPPLPPRPTQQD
jgi:hypothetical protein